MGHFLAHNHRHHQQQQAPQQHYCHRSLFFFVIVAYLLLGYTPTTNAAIPVTATVAFTSTSAGTTAAASVIVDQHHETFIDKTKNFIHHLLHHSDGSTNNLTDVATNETSNQTSILSSMFSIEPVNMSDIGSIFSAILRAFAQALMIFGGIVPYIPQYLIIKRTQNAEGFSNYVCLTLLVANIIRIEFWFGKHFETPLLLQSVVMIICMLIMLELWTRVHSRSMRHHLPVNQLATSASKEQLTETSEKRFTDFEVDYFWRWTTFASYIQFLCLFTLLLSTITWFFLNNTVYVETIGFLAVFFEALLGTPQFMRNLRLKSTEGMSVKMVLMWASGDIFKTVYFILRKAPKQFWLCGSLQIAIDFAILCQVIVYSDKFRGRKR